LSRLVNRAFFQRDLEGNLFKYGRSERVYKMGFSLKGNVSDGFTSCEFECTETLGPNASTALYTGIKVFLIGEYSGDTTQFNAEGQGERPGGLDWKILRKTTEGDGLIMQASLTEINSLCYSLGDKNPFR